MRGSKEKRLAERQLDRRLFEELDRVRDEKAREHVGADWRWCIGNGKIKRIGDGWRATACATAARERGVAVVLLDGPRC